MFASRFGANNATLGGMTDGSNGMVTGNEIGIPTAVNFANWSDLSGFSDVGFGAIDWNDVINQGFAVGSQAIQAFGRNPTTQVGINSNGNIFAITSSTQRPVYDEAQIYAQGTRNAYGVNPYPAQQGVAEDALTSASNFVSQHPIMVFGAIAALFLLYREPPRRR